MKLSSGADAVTRPASETVSAKWLTGGAVFIIGFATFAILNGIQPLMPIFATEFGVSAAESSLVLSLTTLVLAVGMLGASTLSDIFGFKRIMATSLVCASLLWKVWAAFV
jgi:YNFM family putative membrane transporter